METKLWRILTPTSQSGRLEVAAARARVDAGGSLILTTQSGRIVLALNKGQWQACTQVEVERTAIQVV